MKLLTQELRQQLPKLYANESVKLDDIPIVCKFFTPWTQWTWYAAEFDGDDVFYGYICGHENEWGYFSLSELESIKGPVGLTIERDLYWKPRTFDELILHAHAR